MSAVLSAFGKCLGQVLEVAQVETVSVYWAEILSVV